MHRPSDAALLVPGGRDRGQRSGPRWTGPRSAVWFQACALGARLQTGWAGWCVGGPCTLTACRLGRGLLTIKHFRGCPVVLLRGLWGWRPVFPPPARPEAKPSKAVTGTSAVPVAPWLDPHLRPLGLGAWPESLCRGRQQPAGCLPWPLQPKSTLSEQKWVPSAWPCHYPDARP